GDGRGCRHGPWLASRRARPAGGSGWPAGAGSVTVTRIQVGGEDAYQVVIGTGVLGELPGLVGPSARTVVVVHPQGLGEVARPVCGVLANAGDTVHGEEVPAGAAAKAVRVPAERWSRLAVPRL